MALAALALGPPRAAAQQRHAGLSRPGDAPVPGQVVSTLPDAALPIRVSDVTIYHRDGVFYRLAPAGWVVIRAPLGVTLPALPSGAVRLEVGDRAYWYDRGAFYARAQEGDGYLTVFPPVGAVVPSLPTETAAIADIDGVLYYMCVGVFYRPILREGRTVYLVADP